MTERFAIFDDVLSEEQHRTLLIYLQTLDWRSVHAAGLSHSWQFPDDGTPLLGGGSRSAFVGTPDIDPEIVRELMNSKPADERMAIYPTGTPMDFVFDAVRTHAKECEAIVGVAGRDWLGVNAGAQMYPAGAGTSWHRDGAMFSGAFIYYAHPYWNSQWGGELMIAHPSAAKIDPPNKHPGQRVRFTQDEERAPGVMAAGGGAFIVAKANRLVLLHGGTPHKINHVLPAAGNHVRLSIAGFFVVPEELTALVTAARALAEKRSASTPAPD